MKDSLVYWIWLSSIPALGSVRGRKLINYFGSPEDIWHADRHSFLGLQDLGPVLISRIMDPVLRSEAEKHLKNMAKNNIEAITLDNPEYPELLKEIYDPPLVIYKKGKLDTQKCIAVVGSRRASEYGLKVAEKLAYDLAGLGINVVSGLARGIDSMAHEGALRASGITTAVLGCGVDIIYPHENAKLYDRILEHGAIISEYLPGHPPIPGNFPARNRIISGLCKGVAVIEANEKSGSLITANFALEQGRDVFSVPGNIVNSNSKGTNRLIREGAKIVTGVQDILDEIDFFESLHENEKRHTGKSADAYIGLGEVERKIVDQLLNGELHIDALSQRTGIDVKTLNSLLIILELSGYIEQRAGKMFSLKLIK